MIEEKPYMVKQTITYSDGTETVINYSANGDSAAIEKESAEMVADHQEQVVVQMPKVVDEEDESEE